MTGFTNSKNCRQETFHKKSFLKILGNTCPGKKFTLHQGNLVIENCKKRARQALFFATYKQSYKSMISKNPTYLTYKKRQPSETPIKHEMPDHPSVLRNFFTCKFTIISYLSISIQSFFLEKITKSSI